MTLSTDDLRIRAITPLSTPAEVMRDCAAGERALDTVAHARVAVHDILAGQDDRLVVVIGPCSIHDTSAAMEYARRLVAPRPHHRVQTALAALGPVLRLAQRTKSMCFLHASRIEDLW